VRARGDRESGGIGRTASPRLEEPSSAQVHALLQLPEAIRRRLDHLDRVLQTDVDEVRAALRDLLGEIVLQPTPAGLMAELRGNLEGLFALTGEQALVGTTGGGGALQNEFPPDPQDRPPAILHSARSMRSIQELDSSALTKRPRLMRLAELA